VNIVALGGWAYPSSSFSPLLKAWGPHQSVQYIRFDQTLDGVVTQPDLIIGWSLGGLRVLEAVANRTIQPGKMVLISTTARFCASEGYDAGVNQSALRSMMLGLKRNRIATLTAFYKDAVYPECPDNDAMERRVLESDIFPDVSLLQGLRLLDEMDVRQLLTKLTTPTLILHGEKDRIIPAGSAAYLSRQIPHAAIHVHPTSGHEMIIRDDEWIVDRLRDFLRE